MSNLFILKKKSRISLKYQFIVVIVEQKEKKVNYCSVINF